MFAPQRIEPWLLWLVTMGVVPGTGCAVQENAPAELVEKLGELLGDSRGPIHYFAAKADLDQDRRPEWIVHIAGPAVCGTGGCETLVLAQAERGLRLVARISVTRPPLVVAATSTHGWRDLIVHVRGGGILPGYDARLRYDGTSYPPNPTVEPAESLNERAKGEVVIPPFQSFTEGSVLRNAVDLL